MKYILIPIFFLWVFGVLNLFGIRQDLLARQIIYGISSFILFFIMKNIGRHFFTSNTKFFYWSFIILLLITFIVGLEVKGSKRWIDFYLFRFQPSEFLKIFFILYFSEYFSKQYNFFESFFSFCKGIILFLIPFFIIFKQPDLGNSLVFIIIFIIMLLFSSYPKKYFSYFLSISMCVLPILWLFLAEYQKNRIFSFINPDIEGKNTAYNMIQAIITVGSGKFFGKGLGLGTQTKLLFLPENHTDFAFSSLVEQFGFIGGFVVISLYATIIIILMKKCIDIFYRKGQDEKRRFLYILGLISYLVCQIFVNIGMNVGVFPIAGISLPFISYGGSSIAALMIGIALIPEK